MRVAITFTFLLLVGGAELTRAQTVSVWLTTHDQSKLLQQQSSVSFSTGSGGPNCVWVDETQRYQQVEGFGAAFTDTTGYILNQVAGPTARTNAMRNLFTRNGSGIGLSFMRIPMGASDLARYHYSYDDLPAGQTDTNLALFSIAHDLVDIIPLIQQARQLNPQLKLMANPWSPPGWMKTSGSMIGGSLLPSMYGPFANYFVKFLQAYQAQGIPIDYLSLQNEPAFVPGDYPGMDMDMATQTVVLRDYVLPAFAANALTNKVLVFDHNWDYPAYPDTVLSDATLRGSTQVAGIAWHGYGGTPGVMLSSANKYPSKGNYQTEHSGGAWVGDQLRTDFAEIIHVMRSQGRSFVKWNLAGDQNDGPHAGGCATCTPLVIVNSSSGAVSYSIDFYTLGHFSKFVLPGAYRVYSGNAAGIVSAAFLNPDGSKVVVAFNDTTSSKTFQVRWGGQSFSYTLAAHAGATFTWTGTQSGGYTVNPANQIQGSSFNSVSGIQTEWTSDSVGGYNLGYCDNGDYAVYRNVDFAPGFTNVTTRVASFAGGSVEFRLDGPTGFRISSVTMPNTGDWQTFTNVSGSVSGASGVHDLYLVFKGTSGVANLNSFQFGSGLPSPWVTADIGAVAATGSATYNGGTFEVTGSGADIEVAADEFRYVYQTSSGDCSIVARVATQDNPDPWAKAGVMIRESTAAGSINAAVLITPGNGVRFQWRTASGGATTSTGVAGVVAPCWLKLQRGTNSFAAYYSSNGVAWTQVGTSQTIAMASSATLGLAVTSHADGTLCTSTMDNVTVGPPAQPTGLSATPGNKQVALSWTASSGAASYNLKRATVNGGPYTIVTNVATTSCADPGLTNGTTYYYVVSALNAGGESANSSQVSATPTNRPPVLVNDGYTVNEDSTNNLAVLVNDSDPDGTPLTLVSVSTTNGTAAAVGTNVVYTPTPDFSGTNVMTYFATDGTVTNSALITVVVLPVNDAPVLAPIPNQTILAGRTLVVTNSASDADVPAQTLTYRLLSAPAGVSIDTNNGVLTWRPTIAQSAATQAVHVVVSDSGAPVMSATQGFTATVTPAGPPTLDAASITNGQFGFWIAGDAGPDYTIQASTDLVSWSSVATSMSPAVPFFWADTNSTTFSSRFYRTLLGP